MDTVQKIKNNLQNMKKKFENIFFCSGTLEGLKKKPNYEKLLQEPLLRFSGIYSEECPALMVRLQVYNNGLPFGLPVTTSYKAFTKKSK